MKEITHTVASFCGINENPEPTECNGTTAVSMKNFTVTPDLRLRVRDAIVRKMNDIDEEIVQIWSGILGTNEYILVVTDSGYYRYSTASDRVIELGARTGGDVSLIPFGSQLYITTGSVYSVFNGYTVTAAAGYVPLVAVSVPPTGGGVTYEAINMLSQSRRKRYSPDGTATEFVLGEAPLNGINRIVLNGTTLASTDYTADLTNGTVTFATAPAEGINTLEISYAVTAQARETVDKCRFGCTFGGGNDTRMFLYGNPDHPDRRYYSELADGNPSAVYFPENNYTVIPGHRITSLVRHYDRQIIFTSSAAFYSTDELRQDESGQYYHSFPVYSLNSEKGHIITSAPSLLIDNAPVSVCGDGIYRWQSTAVRDERNAVKISGRVDSIVKSMLAERDTYPIRMHDVAAKRELWIYTKKSNALIYNYGLDVWYYYDGLPCSAIGDVNGKMMIGSADGGVFEFSSTALKDLGTQAIDFHYETQYMDMGEKTKLKSVTEMIVKVANGRKTAFRVKLSADGDANTSGFVDCACDGVQTGQSTGIERMRRRMILPRFSGVRMRIEKKEAGSVCEILSLTLKARV